MYFIFLLLKSLKTERQEDQYNQRNFYLNLITYYFSIYTSFFVQAFKVKKKEVIFW